jgi:hypothetical protein
MCGGEPCHRALSDSRFSASGGMATAPRGHVRLLTLRMHTQSGGHCHPDSCHGTRNLVGTLAGAVALLR